MDNDNIIPFGQVVGGKDDDDDSIPVNNYEIMDIDGGLHQAEGFLIFTPQHVAIMRPLDEGALPLVILPLNFVKFARLSPSAEQLELAV